MEGGRGNEEEGGTEGCMCVTARGGGVVVEEGWRQVVRSEKASANHSWSFWSHMASSLNLLTIWPERTQH